MRRLATAIATSAPLAASAEVLDKQPSVAFLISLAAAASLISYLVAKRASGKLTLLGLLPALVFLPVLAEQFDPIMRAAILAEGGAWYVLCVWLGPASVIAAFTLGSHRRSTPSGQ
jgi:hypothetical protein